MLNSSRIPLLSWSLKFMCTTPETLYSELHSIQCFSGIPAQLLPASFEHCWWSPQKHATAERARLVTWVSIKFSCLACRTIMLHSISLARSFLKGVVFFTSVQAWIVIFSTERTCELAGLSIRSDKDLSQLCAFQIHFVTDYCPVLSYSFVTGALRRPILRRLVFLLPHTWREKYRTLS